jgi:hypothetical protein
MILKIGVSLVGGYLCTIFFGSVRYPEVSQSLRNEG